MALPTNIVAGQTGHIDHHNELHTLANTSVFNVKDIDYGATGDGTTNDGPAFQLAINAASAAGGGIVTGPRTSVSYRITTEVTLKSGVSLIFPKGTRITGGVGFGWVFKSIAADSTDLSDVVIDGLNINLASLANAGGIRMEYATGCTLRNLSLTNVAAQGWGVLIGVTNGADASVRNSDILIENCVFDTHAGTLEQLLLFNAQRVTVRKCRFNNLTSSAAHAIGLYQNLSDVLIDDCDFNPVVGGGAYYALSCDLVTFRNNVFRSGTVGIRGAQQSDNGAFGFTRVYNFVVDNNIFQATNVALQLGAVRGARVRGNQFYANIDNCIVIDDGNSPVASQPDNIIIEGNQFRNNNTGNIVHTLHPCIFFQAVGGALNVEIVGNEMWDDGITKTQRYCIVFSGAFTYDEITIANNRLWADTANGGESVKLDSGAVLGPSVRLLFNRDCSNGSEGRRVQFGAGTPASVVTAYVGSVWYRTDGGAGTCLYIKESGTGNTGWIAK